MNAQQRIASAFASAFALGLMGHAAADDMKNGMGKDKEKCFGIAKAGANDCANLSGTHSCAGQATADMGVDEWKYVAKGTCKDMKGISAEQAKAAMAKKG